MNRIHDLADTGWSNQWLPYVIVGVALFGGLLVLLFAPLPWAGLNLLVGGAFLAVAIGSVLHLIARHGGPGERGPDF